MTKFKYKPKIQNLKPTLSKKDSTLQVLLMPNQKETYLNENFNYWLSRTVRKGTKNSNDIEVIQQIEKPLIY